MSQKHASAFVEQAMSDEQIRNEITEHVADGELTDDAIGLIVRIGSNHGFDFSADELREAYRTKLENQRGQMGRMGVLPGLPHGPKPHTQQLNNDMWCIN